MKFTCSFSVGLAYGALDLTDTKTLDKETSATKLLIKGYLRSKNRILNRIFVRCGCFCKEWMLL